VKANKAKPFSYRPTEDAASRLNALVEATEHDKAHFIDKALAEHLPILEARYARELAELSAKHKTVYQLSPDQVNRMNEDANSGERLAREAAAKLLADAEQSDQPASASGPRAGDVGRGKASRRGAKSRSKKNP